MNTGDTGAPSLTLIDLPSVVDLSSGAAAFEVSVQADDAFFPISEVLIYFNESITYSNAVSGEAFTTLDFLGLYGATDDWSDFGSQQVFGVSAANVPGIYNIQRLDVTDITGTTRSYLPPELQSLGVDTSIEFFALTGGGGDPTPVDDGTVIDGEDGPSPVEDRTVIGTDLAERLSGGEGNDTITGLAGNDTITGAGGDDEIDGGPGQDTAVYSGDQISNTLILGQNSITLEDRRTEGNGTDSLASIEFLDFDTDLRETPFDLTTFGGPTALSATDFERFIELYIAYFNRAPDAIGLNFWGTAFANGTSLEEMASLFIDQDETRLTYQNGTTNQEFTTSVYNNVLGREPDQAGFEFWLGALNSEGVGRDQFILAVLDGVKANPAPGASESFITQQLADRAYLETKTDIGAYFAVHKGMSNVENASAAMTLFDGSASSIELAVSAIDGFYDSALDPVNGEFLMQLVGVLPEPIFA
jgi:hypothetical protein